MPSTFKTLILALLITFSFLAASKVAIANSQIMVCPEYKYLVHYLKLNKNFLGKINDLKEKSGGSWYSLCEKLPSSKRTCKFLDDAVQLTEEFIENSRTEIIYDFELKTKVTENYEYNSQKKVFLFKDRQTEQCKMLSDIK